MTRANVARSLVAVTVLAPLVAWGCGETAPIAADAGAIDAAVDVTTSDVAAPDDAPVEAPAPVDASNDAFDAHDAFDAGPRNFVFVSSALFPATLGGLAGADAKCQALASAAGLPGAYKAWLSTATLAAATRLSHSSAPYVLVTGERVADDWKSLTSGNILHALDKTEKGEAPPASTMCPLIDGGLVTEPDGAIVTVPAFFSATDSNGNILVAGWSDCTEWTSETSAVGTTFGGSFYTNVSWSQSCGSTDGCAGRASLLCIQQ